MMHQVRFERRADGGLYRARCTCGWLAVEADLAALQSRAATHDLDWEPVEPARAFELAERE